MAKIKVEVTLRWEGRSLFAGPICIGSVEPPAVMPAPYHVNGDKWIAESNMAKHGSFHATEHEALAALPPLSPERAAATESEPRSP